MGNMRTNLSLALAMVAVGIASPFEPRAPKVKPPSDIQKAKMKDAEDKRLRRMQKRARSL